MNKLSKVAFVASLAVLAILVIEQVSATATCLYCKQMDTTSGMFYSYGYCPSSDKCYLEVWNHPNAWCNEAWVDGYTLDLNDNCKAGIAICQPFVSSEMYSDRNLTGTRTLQAGEMCTIEIDAKNYVGRVLLEVNDNLGVMYNGYRKGEFITVEPGMTLDLTVYNGKSDGPLEFKFIYTGGIRLIYPVLVMGLGVLSTQM